MVAIFLSEILEELQIGRSGRAFESGQTRRHGLGHDALQKSKGLHGSRLLPVVCARVLRNLAEARGRLLGRSPFRPSRACLEQLHQGLFPVFGHGLDVKYGTSHDAGANEGRLFFARIVVFLRHSVFEEEEKILLYASRRRD